MTGTSIRARASMPFFCSALIFILIISISAHFSSAKSPPEDLIRSLRSSLSPLILPLVLSTNSSPPFMEGNFRRQLQKEMHRSDNARMRLYDDLLTNGYYTTRIFIGNPPQEFALIVDSGSTVTYVPCSTCEQCGKHQDPRFQPDLSSTYQPVKCNVDCNCDSENVQCIYERQYAEMSSSSGVLGEDLISFGKESVLQPQRAVFGCENVETGDLFSQHADGIMGLGRGQLSIMDQLVDKGVISDSFSLCYGGMDVGGGAMVLGGISPPPDMVFSHSDSARSPYYNIELKEINVAGKPLQLKPSIFDGKHGTVLDSGTTYAYLPEAAFVAFKDAGFILPVGFQPLPSMWMGPAAWMAGIGESRILQIVNNLHLLKPIHGPDPNYNDICFSGAGSDVSQLSKSFPVVEMVFSNGQKLSLAPENYLFRHAKVHGAYCLGIFQNGKDPTTLLGGIVVRNTLVTYDRENERIGFWKTNCSELWERLHIPGASSPAPSASYRGNTTISVSPSLSPSGPPDSTFPGHFEVGIITFDMSLSVNYLDLMPHTSELAEYIAHELEVNINQVHLLNATSQGNGSRIQWAIFPSGSSDYISNTTAMGIISRLTEHRVRLPDTFGSYKLVEWRVEPPKKRMWWQQHLLTLIVGIIVAVMLSLMTLVLWHVWRHRHHRTLGSYKPVNAAVPEHELQEL